MTEFADCMLNVTSDCSEFVRQRMVTIYKSKSHKVKLAIENEDCDDDRAYDCVCIYCFIVNQLVYCLLVV
jgi:hypothetical protein